MSFRVCVDAVVERLNDVFLEVLGAPMSVDISILLLCKPATPVHIEYDTPRRKDRLKRDLVFLSLRHRYY
jgi:hypothetical protein